MFNENALNPLREQIKLPQNSVGVSGDIRLRIVFIQRGQFPAKFHRRELSSQGFAPQPEQLGLAPSAELLVVLNTIGNTKHQIGHGNGLA